MDANGNSPALPYAGWNTAATNIQDAIDAANPGDLVLVTNGFYQSGGRPLAGFTLTNRIVLDKAVTVQSVNGPGVTIIEGYQVPGTLNGTNATRCAYLTNGAQLIGFTLQHGATLQTLTNIEGNGGGAWCASTNAFISNCVAVSNVCSLYGAGNYSGTVAGCKADYNLIKTSGSLGAGAIAYSVVTDSIINSNNFGNIVGESGGGAYGCVMSNCTINANFRGGVMGCALDHCVVGCNTNPSDGGGAIKSLLSRSVVYSNQTAQAGGGAYDCVLNNCTISNNWSPGNGGGVYFDSGQTNSPGQNNLLIGNSCASYGGGLYLTFGGGNTNWSITGWNFLTNSAVRDGGGLYLNSLGSTISNCTLAGNISGGNGGGFCPSGGTPIRVQNSTFSGNVAQGNGGGAYEAILDCCLVNDNQAANGGGVFGCVSNCVVNDNVASTNGGGMYYTGPLFISPASEFTNNSAVNGGASYGGIFTNCIFSENLAMTNGGAVAIAALSHCLVISNQAGFGGGAYAGGSSGQLYFATQNNYLNCDFIGNSATGDGGGSYTSPSSSLAAINCNFLNNIAANNGGGAYGGLLLQSGTNRNNSAVNGGGFYNVGVSNYQISGNAASGNGGGLYGGSMKYCIVSNNIAGTNGGGSYNTGFSDCLETANSAAYGGGAYLGSFNNSTIAGNYATVSGGGVYFTTGGTVLSCIIYDNMAPAGPNYFGNVAYTYCCMTPLPPASSSNITNDPVFIDVAAANFRLQTNSPCINVGNGSPGIVDLDGRRRTVGRIDMGAYEFQGPGIGEFTAWLQQHGLPTDGSADYTDNDADGMNNWQEWTAGTDPTNSSSLLKIMTPIISGDITGGITLSWQSVSNRIYFVQRADVALTQSSFSTIQSNIAGQNGTTSYTDTNGVGIGPSFYRIGIQ